ncbi:hypothetical protein AYO40_00180 [Planctomycetaceae bacterium SCGC AG-212-D15]|nr:hypothetical protein AYO40_00180 [Planctomycetaceae bacterium SCGC AG-212-D15]
MPSETPPFRCCDGLTRRHMLQAGLMGVAGLSLPDLLRLRARAEEAARDTAVIYVVQDGGASQFETYDPKPNAAADIRGDFAAIRTSVPGVLFSDAMPEQARIMDRLTVLRGIHHPSTQHSSSVHLLKTGYYCRPDAVDNEMPAIGACTARVRSGRSPQVPPYVVLHNGERYDAGHYLGRGFNPFFVKQNENQAHFQIPNLTLVSGLTSTHLQDRRRLLEGFDGVSRTLDRRESDALDTYQRRAFELVTGPAARRAFNLDAEPLKLRERYGMNYLGQSLLLARRLVENGVSFVTVGTFGWDHHGDLWNQMRKDAPPFDRGLATLISDLHERGLARRVLVVVMGEFGRTPKISAISNLKPGRDHWGDVMSVLLAGGGLRGGQVVGASDARGAYPLEGRYRLECVLAAMYRHLGIDPAQTFNDHTGRPRSLLEIRDPITQLNFSAR